MSEGQGFGQQQGSQTGSQTGSDTDGRSPEYRDNLTVQDESNPAGSSGIEQPSSDFNDTATGARAGGTGASTIGAWSSDAGRPADLGVDNGNLGAGSSATAGSGTGLGSNSDSGSDLGGTARSEFGDNTDGLGRDQTDRVTADETGTLISADKVQGTAVYDAGGERLGTIDSLMLNKRSGKVAYAVMSFGGFLGIGERYHPLPWDKLTYDVDKGGYNVGSTQDELRAGPTYSRDELDDFAGSERRDEVDDYYRGVPSALEGGITRSGGIPSV